MPDKPNEPKLTIHVDSVAGSGGSKMSFNATVLQKSTGFSPKAGQGRQRILYDGPYVAGPYLISITARELESGSDDTFSSGTISITLDPNTLQGKGSAEIHMLPGDKGPGEKEEKASYTIVCSADVKPAVEITGDIDLIHGQFNYTAMPPGANGKVSVIVTGRNRPVTMIENVSISGGAQTAKFDWSKFPQAEFHGESVKVQFKVGDKDPVEDVVQVKFAGYGTFQITSFGLPDDDGWTGETELVSLVEEGQPPYRSVHKGWIARVRGQEGRGKSQGRVYEIKDLDKEDKPKDKKVTQWLHETAEAGCANVLMAPNFSLAKQRSDTRFRCRNKILLSTDPGQTFEIHDTGNFQTRNRFDRYIGSITPSTPNLNFPSAYVVKIP
jgi:hypothetical protein